LREEAAISSIISHILKKAVSIRILNKQKAHAPTGDMQWDKFIDVS
jgi:hypothetical protein